MSEQNRTAPRWQDVVIPLVRNERARLEEHLAWTRQLPGAAETARVFREREGARIQARIAPLDAALARLAEPERSAEEERLAEALRTYGMHLMACDRVNRGGGVPCTCGLDALRSGASTAETAPTAAERWRAVPADVRRIVLRWVERGQAQAHRDNVDAYHALTELAREAEGGGR